MPVEISWILFAGKPYKRHMNVTRYIVAAVVAGAGFAQSPARPEFEVASIRPASPVTDRVKVGFHIDGAQLTYTYVSLKDLLQSAYNLRNYQILGPEFVSTDRYDVAAKIPAGGHRDEVRKMLQTLL